MNEKFQPATTEAFALGFIHVANFSVVLSQKSGFDGFEKHTNLPCLHLLVTADIETVTWDVWDVRRGKISSVLRITLDRMNEIIKHFFGRTLAVTDAAWRIEMNSPNAEQYPTGHFYLEIGHKDLFGENGLVRQSVESVLKPDLIGKEALENERMLFAARTLDALSEARRIGPKAS